MSRTLSVRNRQRVRRVNTPLIRRIALHVLNEQLRIDDFELAIHLVAAREMAEVNWNFLQHEGSTDVITFDYSSGSQETFHSEIFICLDDAVKQAREFRTTWQSELTRYVIHGLLHLCGHDDLKPATRRKMKREENRLLRVTAKRFALSKLETRSPSSRANQSAIGNPKSAI